MKSLFKLAHLLTMSNLYKTAIRDVQSEIIDQINSYIDTLKVSNQYDDLVLKVKQFKLTSQIFDAFGISVDNYLEHDLLSSTDTDIDRQFNMAEKKLYNEGVANAYVNQHLGELEINIAKIDVILFVENKECLNKLHEYAENRFHKLNDQYRKYIAKQSESIRKQYDSIVSDSNTLSKHNFRIPETIQVPHEASGSEYSNHLFVDPKTGTAKISLNGWESALIQEEQIQKDFVCWIRNRERASWALCIPYRINNEIRSMYPDFIIVRKDPITGYVVDILEPHCADLKDNLAKAKGFACYAQKNPEVARIQLIRLVNDPSGAPRLKRLDLTQGAVRNKVLDAINNEELDHIFNTDGFYIR